MAEPGSVRAPAGLDVVVPVYGAAAELERCLRSLIRHTRRPPHRLLVVLDGPQPEAATSVVREAEAGWGAGFAVVELEHRRGFVGAANAGLTATSGDVVLLNSDAEVGPGWLENLAAAAASRPEIATVTPLSNHATICSVPETLAENLLPTGHDVDGFAALVAGCAARSYPELPTGVGVCLLIRRAAIDRVGLLDEERFGLGYGEENDLCLRASAAGLVNLLDDATFVYHAGGRSFGASAAALRRRAARRLESRHPGYRRLVGGFIRRDPLRPVRERVVAALEEAAGISPGGPAPHPRVLHVVHGWPPFNHAGTEIYARRLALAQASRHPVSVFARVGDPGRPTGAELALFDNGVRARLVVNNFDQRDPLQRNALVNRTMERALAGFVADEKPDIVHVHHLAGHAASLTRVPRRLGLPVVYQVQDWWALCARANLVQGDGSPCPGPAPGRCAACLPLTGLPPSALLNRLLYRLRRRLLRRALARADAYVMGSEAILGWYREAGMLAPGVSARVLRYGVPDLTPKRSPAASGRPLVFGFIGSLMPHKGPQVAVAAFRGLDGGRAELRVWGDPSGEPEFSAGLRTLAAGAPVRFEGRFAETEREQVLGQIDVLVVPSIGMESFGIVAWEALSAGVPVLASRLGALAELPVEGRCGALLPPGDPQALRTWVERLVADPGLLTRWRGGAPPVTGVEEHADALEEVYARALEGR